MKNADTSGRADSGADNSFVQDYYEIQYSGFRAGKPTKWLPACRTNTLAEAREKFHEVREQYRKRIVHVVAHCEVVE